MKIAGNMPELFVFMSIDYVDYVIAEDNEDAWKILEERVTLTRDEILQDLDDETTEEEFWRRQPDNLIIYGGGKDQSCREWILERGRGHLITITD